MINLGDLECAKEVNINILLNETQRKGLIHLLAEYVDVFVWEVGDIQGLIPTLYLINCRLISGSIQ